jgi:L-seryl-tRNA(Ser) seleniumtransferase
VLAALQQVALAYLARDVGELPFWRMATEPADSLAARAKALGAGRPVDTVSVAGGGTLPGIEIPSAGVAVDGDRTSELRAATPPIIARVHEGETVLDLRTVEPADDPVVAAALRDLS